METNQEMIKKDKSLVEDSFVKYLLYRLGSVSIPVVCVKLGNYI